MADNLHNASELIEELEGLSIKTTQGSYVKMEDIRRLIEKREQAQVLEEEEKPKPKTLDEARAGAKKFLTEKIGKQPIREPGKALPATEPQPSSRT